MQQISECSKLAKKYCATRHDRVGKVIYSELCKKLKSDHTNKWYYIPKICPGEWNAQTSLGFWDTSGPPNLRQTTRPSNNQQQQKKRTCRIVDFAVPVVHRVKLKENEKKDKYLDLGRGLKKLWNVTFIPIVICALGTVSKGLIKRLEDLK